MPLSDCSVHFSARGGIFGLIGLDDLVSLYLQSLPAAGMLVSGVPTDTNFIGVAVATTEIAVLSVG